MPGTFCPIVRGLSPSLERPEGEPKLDIPFTRICEAATTRPGTEEEAGQGRKLRQGPDFLLDVRRDDIWVAPGP